MATSLLNSPRPNTRSTPARWVFRHRGQLVAATVSLGIILALISRSGFSLPGAPLAWVAIAGFLICLGITTRIWASLYIGGRKNKQVVQTGPFALTRNPLYSGNLISALGLGLLTGSWLTIAVVMPLLAVIWFLTVISEESKLQSSFGQDYENYRQSVPRFFPDRRLAMDLESPTSITHQNLPRELRRGLLVLSLASAILLLRGFDMI